MSDLRSVSIVEPSARVAIPQQATSDSELISLWLGGYRSPNTIGAYQTDIREFMACVAPKPLRSVTVRDIQDFAGTLSDLSGATMGRRLSAVKSLISFGHRIGYLPFDVGAPIKLPSIKDDLAERILTEADVTRLLWHAEAPERRGVYVKRDAALLRLLYSAGVRISEAVGLCWRDVVDRDEGTGQITVYGKGGKTRAILLPAAIWTRLSALRFRNGPTDPVFRSRNGGPVTRSQAHRIVKLAVKRAKLSGKISAHYLRHSHASHALDRGAPVHVVQTTLGHASLTTTTRYTHVRPGDSSSRYLGV